MHNISFSGVTYAWPGEDPIFENVSFSFSRGIHALAGPNGAGKTTLLRLVAGEIEPRAGSIRCNTVPRLVAAPNEVQACYSSGEQQMFLLETSLAQNQGVLLFDEPERHLDEHNRRRFLQRLSHFPGTIVLATHEPALLDLAETILHVERRSVRLYRMPYSAYYSTLDAERAALLHEQQRAERALHKLLHDSQRELQRQLRRERIAALRAPTAGIPRVARGLMKRNAEKTRGKIISRTRERIGQNEAELASLRAQKQTQAQFSFECTTGKASGMMLEVTSLNFVTGAQRRLWQEPLSFSARAGEKIRIAGLNGSGKSLLLSAVRQGYTLPRQGDTALRCKRLVLLDQDYSTIPAGSSVLALAQENFPARSEGEVRRLLGAYGFPGSAVFRDFRQCSAGERVRLLVLLLSNADTPPDVLLADEAETGLDREVRLLFAKFLNSYRGLLLFVTHSEDFAAQVQPTRTILLRRH